MQQIKHLYEGVSKILDHEPIILLQQLSFQRREQSNFPDLYLHHWSQNSLDSNGEKRNQPKLEE